uniref:Metalloendopeptidase n=1 Tax=Globodera rostochiensis TaxID=31243 RepID=A0A914HW06_GLORO
MRLTCRALVRKVHTELDYARHFPKAFVDNAQRKVPLKVYDNRFGAPPVIRWAIRPDDWMTDTKRPWEAGEVEKIIKREKIHQSHLFSTKFFRKNWNKMPRIPAEKWTIFPGDTVRVMVGKHRGRTSNVSHVIKEANAVFVEGLHTKLVDKYNKERMKKMDIDLGFFDQWEEQPLFVHKGEVQLVDPNDGDPCTAKWVLNDSKTQYERVSNRTGFIIPLPNRAFTSYEYISPATYLEVLEKDTPADVVLKRTFMLCSHVQMPFLNTKYAAAVRVVVLSRRLLHVLGIESSCDDAAVAIVNFGERRVLADRRSADHANLLRLGGVLPYASARHHRAVIGALMEEALNDADLRASDVDAVAVSNRPGLVYCLKVGVEHALAFSRFDFPFLTLLASGAHCLICTVSDPNTFHVMADSAGGSPGECLDKLARELGLSPYKGSFAAALEQLAIKCPLDEIGRFALPPWSFGKTMEFDMVKCRYLRLLQQRGGWRDSEDELAVWCAGIQHSVTEMICQHLDPALAFFASTNSHSQCHLVVAGGVAANAYLRRRVRSLAEQRQFAAAVVLPPELCTDNGVMVAWTGAEVLAHQREEGTNDRPTQFAASFKKEISPADPTFVVPRSSIGPSHEQYQRRLSVSNGQIARFRRLLVPMSPAAIAFFPLLFPTILTQSGQELFSNQSNVMEETNGNVTQPPPMTGDLPDFWRMDSDTQSVQQKRNKLVEEVLGMKKYEKMRRALEMIKKSEGSLNVSKTADNVLAEVELMQQVNRIGAQPTNSSDFVPPDSVPTLQRVNSPIGEMLFQGDILLNEHQADEIISQQQQQQQQAADRLGKRRRRRQVQKGRIFPLNKWNVSEPIAYRFDVSINENTRRLVRLAAQFWQDNSCVSFQEDGQRPPKVRIFKGQGCYSQVGRETNAVEQEMSLGAGCEVFGTITHEFGHLLGMFHHHARQDRDEKIQVITENIEPGWKDQYRKETADRSDLEGIGYNYASNMHYGGTNSDSVTVVMAAKHKHFQHTMGNNKGPVFLDLVTVNKYYKCFDKCPSGVNCQNDGFRNPRNCQKCICPEGFGGDNCGKRAASDAGGIDEPCGETVTAENGPKGLRGSVTPKTEPGRLMSDRQAVCHYHIEAPPGSRVQLEFISLSGTCTPECHFGAVEIKLGDFKKGGIRICCEKHIAELGGTLVTEAQRAIVSVYSQRNNRTFTLTHKITSDSAPANDDFFGSRRSPFSLFPGPPSSLSILINAINGWMNSGSPLKRSDTDVQKELRVEDEKQIKHNVMLPFIHSYEFTPKSNYQKP